MKYHLAPGSVIPAWCSRVQVLKNYAPVDPKQFFHIHCSVCVHVGGFTGNWCAALWISLARVLVSGSGFPFICLLLCLIGFRVSPRSHFTVLSLSLSLSPSLRLSRCLSLLVCLHLFPALLPILGSVVWLSGCLFLCVVLYVLPTLASGIHMFGYLLIAFVWLPSFLPIHLSPNSFVFSPQSALQWWCLILSLFLEICFIFQMPPKPCVSPSGGSLFLFHRDVMRDWSLSLLFFSHCVLLLSQELHCYTSTDPREQ